MKYLYKIRWIDFGFCKILHVDESVNIVLSVSNFTILRIILCWHFRINRSRTVDQSFGSDVHSVMFKFYFLQKTRDREWYFLLHFLYWTLIKHIFTVDSCYRDIYFSAIQSRYCFFFFFCSYFKLFHPQS